MNEHFGVGAAHKVTGFSTINATFQGDLLAQQGPHRRLVEVFVKDLPSLVHQHTRLGGRIRLHLPWFMCRGCCRRD